MKKTMIATGIAMLSPLFLASTVQAEELKFWMVTPSNPLAADALNEIADSFNKQTDGSTIKIEGRSIDQHKASLRIAATSGLSPDVFFSWAGYGLGGEYVRAGLSAPLNEYYEKYNWQEKLLPTATAFANQYGGDLHGVPYSFRGEALYYNKDLFAKAGISELPKTYDELVQAAEKLKAKRIPAITFGGSVNWHLMRLMDVILEAKCGAETHDQLKALSLDWSTEACVKTSFSEFHKWTENYVLKPFMGYNEEQSFNLFSANRAAMMLEGDWLVGKVISAKIDDHVGVFPFPTDTNRLYGFAEYLYVSEKSKDKESVAKFLDYFMSNEIQQKYVGVISSTSVNKNVEYKDQNALDKEWVSIFNSYKETFVNGDQAFPLSVTNEYFRIINEVATNSLAPESAGSQLQKFVNNNL